MMSQHRPAFYQVAARMRELAEIHRPSKPQVREALDLIRDEAYARYFFALLGQLANVGWLVPLASAGAFDEPPEPIRVGDGTLELPTWPASGYLARIGAESPREVLEIARRVRTHNSRVIVDLLYACLQMAPADAAEIVPKLDEWIETPYLSLIPEQAGDLLGHLAKGEEWGAALSLVEILTRPLLPPSPDQQAVRPWGLVEVQPRFDKWYFDRVVRSQVGTIAEAKPLQVLDILETQLRRAIELELSVADSLVVSDHSLGWRAAIESHEQNRSRTEFKNVIVEIIRDLGETIATREPEVMEKIAGKWLEHEYSIFRRLAIHLVRLQPECYPDLLIQLFSDRANLDDTVIHHEFYLLLESAFDKAPQKAQEQLLEWIVEGEPPDELERSREFYRDRYGEEPPDDVVRKWKEHWTLTRLWALRSHELPTESQGELDRLVAEMGPPQHPDFLIYTTTHFGPATPISRAKLEHMTADEVVQRLLSWEPPKDASTMLSREGLGRALEGAVKSKPRTYSWATTRFLQAGILRDYYLQRLLWGLHEAWASGRHLSWKPILDACDQIVHWREEWADEARRRVADLLTTALRKPDHYLPKKYMREARDLLLELVNDPDPRPDFEEKWLSTNPDPVSLAINSVRGKALEALLDYAKRHKDLWRTEERTYRRYAPSRYDFDHQVRKALDDRLVLDESRAIRSVFGERLLLLYWLDKDWTRERLPQLFPARPGARELWQATWDAYVSFSKVSREVFELLRPQYRRALKELGARSRMGQEPSRSAYSLAQHLMIAYWVGLEGLDHRPGLLGLFYDQAPNQIRSQAVWMLWRLLAEQKPDADSEEWHRAKTLWHRRAHAAHRADEPQNFADELLGFLRWLDSVPEGLASLYSLIEAAIPHYELARGPGRSLPEFLERESSKHPALACQLLLQVIDRAGDEISALVRPDEIRTILQQAIDSRESDALSCAVDAINLLGELGAWEYRSLLNGAQ